MIEERKLEPIAVLVTHGHIDHVGAVAAVARSTGAPVYSSRREAPWLRELDGSDYPGYEDAEPHEPDAPARRRRAARARALRDRRALRPGPLAGQPGVRDRRRAVRRRRALPRLGRPHRPARGGLAHAAGEHRLAAGGVPAGDACAVRATASRRRSATSAPRTRFSRSCAGERARARARRDDRLAAAARRAAPARRSRPPCASSSARASARSSRPTFEDTALFARTAGDASDVVSKEMYSFTDRGERELTLRPEGTAPVVRAYLEHGQAREPQPVKLWYVAPMFRYAAGAARPLPRALAVRRRVARLGRPGGRRRGDRAAGGLVRRARAARRPRAAAQLDRRRGLPAGLPRAARGLPRALPRASCRRTRRRGSTSTRCASSTRRTRATGGSSRGAPRITDHLCDACAEHFASVRAFLDARGVAYRVDARAGARARLLRAHGLGVGHPRRRRAGGPISGGGRYDGLAEQIGGKRVPGVGFGCGIERVVLALEDGRRRAAGPVVDWFVRLRGRGGAAAAARAARAGARARARLPGRLAGRSLKGQLRHAERLGARVITVCRAGDGARGIVRHGETEIAFGDLVDYVERSVRGQ